MSGRVLVRGGAALAVWAGLVYVARTVGATPDVPLVGLAVAASAGVLWLFVDGVTEVASATWDLPGDEPIHQAGQDPRLAALTRAVAGHFEARVPDDTLQRLLMGLVDQRLMARYGVSWRVDPDRAGDLLPPELADLARQVAPYPRMSTRQVDVLLTRIEAL
jgi:hypothetical protein